MKIFQFILGIAILCIVFFRIDLKEALNSISKVNILLLVAISLITVPQIFLKSLRWRYILKLQNIKFGVFNSFIAYAKGIYCGMITPARVGELIKVVYLKNEKNVEPGEGLSSVLLDRLFDFYFLLCICIFSLLRFAVTERAVWMFTAVMLISMPLMILVIKIDKLGRFFKNIFKAVLSRNKKGFLTGQAEYFYYGIRKITASGIMFSFLFTIFIYAMAFTQYYLLSRLIELKLSFVNIVFVSSIASFVAVLPVSFLGIGTRDATLVYLFSQIGIPGASAVVYSFLMFFSFYIIGAFVGFLSWNVRFRKPEAGRQK